MNVLCKNLNKKKTKQKNEFDDMLKSEDKIKMTKATIAVDRHKCKLLTIIRGLWQTFLIKKSISMEFIHFICFFVVGLQ